MNPSPSQAESTSAAPLEPRARLQQADDQLRRAMTQHGEARLAALQRALQLNPFALKARYQLALTYLKRRQLALARPLLDDLAQRLPQSAALQYYQAVAAIQDPKKGDLEKAENLLKALEASALPGLTLTLCRLELALRRKKNPPPVAVWLSWLEQIPVTAANIPLIADKCAKFFMERSDNAAGDEVLAWLERTWRARFPAASLLNALPWAHHIKYWPQARWLPELREQVFDETAGDVLCLFILDRLKKDEQGADVSEEAQLTALGALVEQLPGLSGLAYNYLAMLSTAAKQRLLTASDAEGALALWRSAVKLDRFNALVQFNMALAEARQGRPKEYYDHWRAALKLAAWRWELSDDRSDWELCAARARATASKLRERLDAHEHDKQDAPAIAITAWVEYVDLSALLQQLTYTHPSHQLGLAPEAGSDEVQRTAQIWLAKLRAWETDRLGRTLVPSEFIAFARGRLQLLTSAARTPPSVSEQAAFSDYCRQRADLARDVFVLAHRLRQQNRFEEARRLVIQLNNWPLNTLAPYLADLKIPSDEGELSFADLINTRKLAEWGIDCVAAYAAFVAEEGDDEELRRQLARVEHLPWAQLDDPAAARRKVRTNMAFSVLDITTFKAMNAEEWETALPFVEAGLRRLPDQLDLLWLAAFVIYHRAESDFDADPDQVPWDKTRAALQRAVDYHQRALQTSPADEVAARWGGLQEAVVNALDVASALSTPQGQALRRARALLKQEQWTQAYQVLSQLPSKDRNAEVECYLGLALYREIQEQLEPGKKRPSLSDFQKRLEKAANHLRAAARYPAEDELREMIDNLSQAVAGMLDQVKYAQVSQAAMELMERERWDEAYDKWVSLAHPGAEALFYMAHCRFQGTVEGYNHSRLSIAQVITRLEQALKYVQDGKRLSEDDDLTGALQKLEGAIRKNLNIIKTM